MAANAKRRAQANRLEEMFASLSQDLAVAEERIARLEEHAVRPSKPTPPVKK